MARFSMIAGFALGAAFLGAVSLGAAPPPARAQSILVQDLIGVQLDLTEMCQGLRADDPHSDEACNASSKVGDLLGKLGYCADKPYHWERCARRR